MYVTGDMLSFETRLHELANDNLSLQSFRIEGSTYLGLIDVYLSGKWEREARQQQYHFSGVSGLLTQQF